MPTKTKPTQAEMIEILALRVMGWTRSGHDPIAHRAEAICRVVAPERFC